MGILHLLAISTDSTKLMNEINITLSLLTEHNESFYSEVTSLSTSKRSSNVMTIPANLLENINTSYIIIDVKVDDSINDNEYKLVYRGGYDYHSILRKVLILENDKSVQPPVPQILSAFLMNDGNVVELKFSGDTNRGKIFKSTFYCSELLIFLNSDVTICQWITTRKMEIRINKESALDIGSEIIFIDGKIRARCNCDDCDHCDNWNTMHSVRLTVDYTRSVFIMYPKVIISGSTKINSIEDNLQLSVSFSIGRGSRQWKSINYDVNTIDSNGKTSRSDKNINRIMPYLQAASKQKHLDINLPSQSFNRKYKYSFIITMCNFANFCDVGLHVITIVDIQKPTLMIVGANYRKIKASSSLNLLVNNARTIDINNSTSNSFRSRSSDGNFI